MRIFGSAWATAFAQLVTLVATNAIVTRTVAKTAFVTTMGFPDTLVLKEGGKVNPHDFTKEIGTPNGNGHWIAQLMLFEKVLACLVLFQIELGLARSVEYFAVFSRSSWVS